MIQPLSLLHRGRNRQAQHLENASLRNITEFHAIILEHKLNKLL